MVGLVKGWALINLACFSIDHSLYYDRGRKGEGGITISMTSPAIYNKKLKYAQPSVHVPFFSDNFKCLVYLLTVFFSSILSALWPPLSPPLPYLAPLYRTLFQCDQIGRNVATWATFY